MAKSDVPGARHLSAKAKEVWLEQTTPEQLPHFRQVIYNMVHEYCFWMCGQPKCDGCAVVKLRSWVANVKALPQSFSTPVIREMEPEELEKLESETKRMVVEEGGTKSKAD